MKNQFIKLVLLGVVLIFCGIAVRKYFFKSWTPYYQEKLYKEPRPLLVKSLEFFKDNFQEKLALDLGAGAGNDTAYLLKQGWKVWANDIEQEAIRVISLRNDISSLAHNLTLIHKGFTDLPWDSFPQFDLVYAGCSLPFAKPSEFMGIWYYITQAVKPGGIFAGHFFGPDHGAFNWWEKRKMTFLTKEQLLAIFEGFQIETFEECYEQDERGLFDHSFSVIARKI